MKRYDPRDIEPKWQKKWQDDGTYEADLDSARPKYMAMSMFNYPSGAGIHIGHAMNYTISDVKARFKRQQGFESYHPVGWDAFGLPAENYAIKSGVSPQASMATIIPDYHTQYRAMGWSNDWSKEIATHEPNYYRWTQWIFAQMYRHNLVYQDARLQWWCTKCQTVLANEQVIDGKCWRHDGPEDPLVEQREVKQWFFKITDYADELLEATDTLDWSESVKLAQKNWIGKSIGAEVDFSVEGSDGALTVFTTRVDTLYGVTFLVIAPEHELVETLTVTGSTDEMKRYVAAAKQRSEVDRQAGKDKTGVFTGSYAINPINGERVPIWVADYVLTGYGTGAIMAVPAHDERDHAFATKFNLPVVPVVAEDFGLPLDDAQDVTGSVVIVYDKTTQKYLGIKTGTNQGLWLAGGGSEAGESFEQTAIRELAEETGFSDYESVAALGDPVFSYYFNDVKKVNKRSFGQGFLFVVDGLTQGRATPEAHEKFELGWYDYEKLVKGVTQVKGGVEHWLAMLERARTVVSGKQLEIFHGDGIAVNSGPYNGVSSAEAREQIVSHLVREGKGRERTSYRMRDWSVSRQRYWGAPIPVVYCKTDGIVLLPDDQLPVVLPELEDFQPSGDGRSALARATDWVKTTCPTCGGPAERETDTLDTYIDSAWYMYRFMDPRNDEAIFDPARAKRWEPVDFYNGADHATAHLLYARFVGHFFKKIGLVDQAEPFKQFLFNGKVTASDGTMFSKSKGNGVDPLEIINQGYGADALRTYLMFAAPLELWAKWDPQGVPGTHRFLSRLWNLVQEYTEAPAGDLSADIHHQLNRTTHATIKKMTIDLEANRYNTAIAAAMAQVNELYKLKVDHLKPGEAWGHALSSLVACVAPFAPHIADELWRQLGQAGSVQRDSWPTWDESMLVSDRLTIAVQVNGKLRAEVEVPANADTAAIEAAALANERIRGHLGDKTPRRVIVVPGRLVNIVV
ncbi:MAG TPA: class I tRNA ligase family protein [Candidatus Saccharimonadales bacterium]